MSKTPIVVHPAGREIFRWFTTLSNRRSSNGFGPNPIGFEVIAAWAKMMQVAPTPWDVEVINLLDDVWMAHQLDPTIAKRNEFYNADVSQRELSPVLFDALFK